MRAEPGPTIRVFLPSIGSHYFCPILQKLTACLSELGVPARLAPSFIRIDPRQLAGESIYPIPLHDLGKEIEELARCQSKVSFTIRLEGTAVAHTWQVSVATTLIPVLTARRVSTQANSRNYEREISWAKKSLSDAVIHSVATSSPDYSDFAEWALPQCFYLLQKIVMVPQLKLMAEVEPSKGAVSPIWPFPTELSDAIACRFGTEPLLISESDRAKGKLIQQIDDCLLSDASKTALDVFLSTIGVSSDVWFGSK